MTGTVLERHDGVVSIGLDRPEKHNALDQEMVDALHADLDTAQAQACVIVFHSTRPDVFVAGADIAQLRERRADDALRRINGELFDRIARHRWPTIAVIDGPALGGGSEFALACDFRFATENAVFAQPEPRLGIIAGAGAHQRLERTAGLSVARRLLFGGETIAADEAARVGLVDRRVPAGGALAKALEYAARMAGASWRALELTKLALSTWPAPSTTAFDAAAQALLFESEDKQERMTRFLDRRSRPASS